MIERTRLATTPTPTQSLEDWLGSSRRYTTAPDDACKGREEGVAPIFTSTESATRPTFVIMSCPQDYSFGYYYYAYTRILSHFLPFSPHATGTTAQLTCVRVTHDLFSPVRKHVRSVSNFQTARWPYSLTGLRFRAPYFFGYKTIPAAIATYLVTELQNRLIGMNQS